MDLYQGFRAGEPHEFVGVKVDGRHVLEASAAKAFLEMRDAAAQANIKLVINSAFRTNIEQEVLYKRHMAGGPLASKPGFSKHQSGVAVDIQVNLGSSPIYRWLCANAARYGFKQTVAAEPWHWEFLGRLKPVIESGF